MAPLHDKFQRCSHVSLYQQKRGGVLVTPYTGASRARAGHTCCREPHIRAKPDSTASCQRYEEYETGVRNHSHPPMTWPSTERAVIVLEKGLCLANTHHTSPVGAPPSRAPGLTKQKQDRKSLWDWRSRSRHRQNGRGSGAGRKRTPQQGQTNWSPSFYRFSFLHGHLSLGGHLSTSQRGECKEETGLPSAARGLAGI